MAITVKPRTGLKIYGAGSDPHPTRAEHNTMIDTIEGAVVVGASGLLSARPAAGKGRAFYYATDVGPTGAIFFDTGTGWRDVSSVGGVAASGVSIAGASSEGVSTAAARADHVHAIPLATTSAHGAMSSTDKVLLSGAVSAATANTLAKRDASGRIQVASPSATADAAPKSYVDAQVGTRALAAHSHPWADITGAPATYAPSAHSHPWADITGAPATYAPSAHSHAAADVTSGVFATSRLPASTQAAPGTMSAADKVKLDAASSAPTASTIMMTDAAGRYQAAAPSATLDVANKEYVDARDAEAAPLAHSHSWAQVTDKPTTFAPEAHAHAWGDLPAAVELGDAVDFDTLTTRNVYHQSSSAEAGTTPNSPSPNAGLLVVENSSTNFIYQWYYEYGPYRRIFYRTKYNTTWYDWREVSFTDHGHSAATSAVAGFMSANDKAKLDASSSTAGPNVILRANTTGYIAVLAPTSASHPATKAYVDDGLGDRSVVGHTHTWASITGKPSTFAPSTHTHTGIGNGSSALYVAGDNALVGEMVYDRTYGSEPNMYVTSFGTIGRSTIAMARDVHTHAASSITSGTFAYARIRGTDEVHVRTATNRSVWVDSDGRFGQNTSSIRFKENVRDADLDPAAILRLRPRIYDRKNREEGVNEFGLIAEEVEAEVPTLALYDRDGVLETVAYEKLAVAHQIVLQDLDRRLSAAGL